MNKNQTIVGSTLGGWLYGRKALAASVSNSDSGNNKYTEDGFLTLGILFVLAFLAVAVEC